jgi:cellulose synthase (UDP-forming)
VQVSYLEFLAYSLLPTSSAVLLVAWVGRQGWLRPEGAKLLSWEAALFQLARWPWVLLGVASAIRTSVFKHKVTWRVTPKQRSRAATLPVQLLMPYIGISLLSAVASLATSPKADVRGYYWFTLTNWFCYLLVVIISLYCHLKENE